MDTNWIVTANAGKARIFAQEAPESNYREIEDMINEGVRVRMENDATTMLAAGKSRHNSGNPGPQNGYEPQQLPNEHETEVFARELHHFLEKAHHDHRYSSLTIAASPEFLGVLRKFLHPKLEPVIAQEINKDYTGLSLQQLQEVIEAKGAAH